MTGIRANAVSVAMVVVVSGVFASAAQTAGTSSSSSRAAKCAHVKVTARPAINTSMTAETIRSKVTSCAKAKETVILMQTISGPDATNAPMAKTWKITLAPAKSVVKTRSFPYSCCGSYVVTDKVVTKSGRQLAKASADFTFA